MSHATQAISTKVDVSISFQESIAQTPFCDLPKPNFNLLLELVTTKREAAIYHVVHLRQNPDYHLQCMEKWKNHLLSDKKRKTPSTSTWLLVLHGYQMVWLWNAAHSAMEQSRKEQSVNDFTFTLFQMLQDALDEIIEYSRRHLEDGVPTSNTFGKHLELTTSRPTHGYRDGRNVISNYDPKPNTPDSVARLLHLLTSICSEDSRSLSLQSFTGQIDRLLSDDALARVAMDSWLNEIFSDLAVVCQIQAQLRFWEPQVPIPQRALDTANCYKVGRKEQMGILRETIARYCQAHPPDVKQLRCFGQPTSNEMLKYWQRRACEYGEGWWRDLDNDLDWYREGEESIPETEEIGEAWLMIMAAVKNLHPLWKLGDVAMPSRQRTHAAVRSQRQQRQAPHTTATAAKGTAGLSIAGSGSSELSSCSVSFRASLTFV